MKVLFVLTALICSSPSLLAMDMDNHDIQNRQVSWAAQSRAIGEIMEELLTFKSQTTGTMYELNMRYNWPLKNYIQQLKRDERLSKDEGVYNYNGQNFDIKGKPCSGDRVITYQDARELIEKQQVIVFKFHPIRSR